MATRNRDIYLSIRFKFELFSFIFIFTLFCFDDVTGIVPIDIHEKKDRPRLLASDGVPFVPEEFRDYNNIIFNRIDFREITEMTQAKTDGLESLLLQMIKNETELNAETPPEEIFVSTNVKYVGRGMWTNNGRNARLAVTLEGLVCGNQAENEKCHTKRCHLELNETFLPPPWPLGEDVDSRRQNLSILRWSCARKERWCYACRDPQSLDFSSSDPNGNGTEDLEYQAEWPTCQSEDDPTKSDDTLFKLNCNRQFGDLSRGKQYGCSVSFTQVAGVPTEIQSRSCVVVDAGETSDEIGICQTDAIDYNSQCTCHRSGCNGNIFVRKKVLASFSPARDSITKEVQSSIRQLRADMERMMKRYSMVAQQQQPQQQQQQPRQRRAASYMQN